MTKRKGALVVALLLGAGCKESPPPPPKPAEVCDMAQATTFIVECARAANPLSDEEGEHLVLQCERTALHLYCSRDCNVDAPQPWGTGKAWCQ